RLIRLLPNHSLRSSTFMPSTPLLPPLPTTCWQALVTFNEAAMRSIKWLVRFRCSSHAESHAGFTFPFRLYRTGTASTNRWLLCLRSSIGFIRGGNTLFSLRFFKPVTFTTSNQTALL